MTSDDELEGLIASQTRARILKQVCVAPCPICQQGPGLFCGFKGFFRYCFTCHFPAVFPGEADIRGANEDWNRAATSNPA